MPNGRLTKKIQRHPIFVTMYPPSVGPIAGPAMTIDPKSPCAIACSSFGNVSKRIACAFARRPPPVSPWRIRAMTSIGNVVAVPQSIEATRETDEREDEVLLLAEPIAEPRRERKDDDVGDPVARNDPAHLRERRAERRLDVTQRDVHDARVDDLEERPEGDRDRDEPLVARLGRAVLQRGERERTSDMASSSQLRVLTLTSALMPGRSSAPGGRPSRGCEPGGAGRPS